MGFIDTHCHLNDDETYKEHLDEILKQCKDVGVDKMIVVGYDLTSSKRAVELADQYDSLYAAVGVHPSDSDTYTEDVENELRLLVKEHKKVVAIGEIGLDYHYENVPREIQKEVFEKQVLLAKELNMPIIIHNREAMEDTHSLIDRHLPIRGIMHCYSGSIEMAKRFMKQGFYISFAGPVTFKNATSVKETAASIPLDRLLVETDCPYMTPTPHRGTLNYPYFVNLVGEEVAKLHNISVEELSKIEKENVFNLFGI